MSYSVIFKSALAPSAPLQQLVAQNVLQNTAVLTHPRIIQATWRGEQGIVLDATAAADWLLPISLEGVGQQLASAEIATPALTVVDDDIWFCAASPCKAAAKPAYVADKALFAPETADTLLADCAPLVYWVIPQVTGRPLPNLAYDELRVIMRGLAGALAQPNVLTLGVMATFCTINTAKTKTRTAVLPLCMPRFSHAARDAEYQLLPPQTASEALFWWLNTIHYLGIAVEQKHHDVQQLLWKNLSRPIAELTVLQQWLNRWVPQSLRVSVANWD
jgi:hypothetical protein